MSDAKEHSSSEVEEDIAPDGAIPGTDNVGADADVDGGTGLAMAEGHKRKPLGRRIVGVVISVGLILVIFLGVIPQFANYSEAWDAIQKMSPGWWVALAIATVVNQMSYVWPYQAVLPHLRFRMGFMETQTTSAISNTVPAGGAVAVGMTFKMFGSFGFSPVAISTAVVDHRYLDHIVQARVAHLGRRARGGHGPEHGRSGGGGRARGSCDRCRRGCCYGWCSAAPPAPSGSGDWVTGPSTGCCISPTSPNRSGSSRACSTSGTRPTRLCASGASSSPWPCWLSQGSVMVLVFFCIRSVGIPASEVSGLEALLAIAVARLVGVIPLTPGGLGTIDAAFIGMLTALGANSSVALAADMVWRVTTYFPPIFVGIITYFIWKRGMAKGVYATHPDARSARHHITSPPGRRRHPVPPAESGPRRRWPRGRRRRRTPVTAARISCSGTFGVRSARRRPLSSWKVSVSCV